ncbi:hypothetical protein FOA52_013296 [Chlamydomonas sp. UWO 241]|nr:hypothetical protein FOA52_013296 [Chlamydomonas sp. UWO 241]
MGIAHSASTCWWDSDLDSLDGSRHLKSLDMSQLMTYYEFVSATPRPIDREPVPREPPLLHMCHGNPGETIRFNPLVLRRGTTIEMHLGYGVNFGNRPGVATAHSLPTDDFGGDVCVRYKLRNHSVMLSGPLRAKQLMQALSTGVRMEIGRNAILNTRIFGEDHQTLTEAAERFVVPEPASGIVCAMWRESAFCTGHGAGPLREYLEERAVQAWRELRRLQLVPPGHPEDRSRGSTH